MKLRFSADKMLLVAYGEEYEFVKHAKPRCCLCAFETACATGILNLGRPRMRCAPPTRTDGHYGYWKQTDKKEETPCRQVNTGT